MKYQKLIISGLIIIIIGAVFYYINTINTDQINLSNPSQKNNLQPTGKNVFSTQTLTDGTVTYRITPKNVTINSQIWEFEINLDTHTGSLDQDLVTLVRMVNDKGNEYKALEWEGDPAGGHHRGGVLKFSPVTPRPALIELKLQTSDNKEKNLRWKI